MNIKTNLLNKGDKTLVLYLSRDDRECTDAFANYLTDYAKRLYHVNDPNLAIITGKEYNTLRDCLEFIDEANPSLLVLESDDGGHYVKDISSEALCNEVLSTLQIAISNGSNESAFEALIRTTET